MIHVFVDGIDLARQSTHFSLSGPVVRRRTSTLRRLERSDEWHDFYEWDQKTGTWKKPGDLGSGALGRDIKLVGEGGALLDVAFLGPQGKEAHHRRSKTLSIIPDGLGGVGLDGDEGRLAQLSTDSGQWGPGPNGLWCKQLVISAIVVPAPVQLVATTRERLSPLAERL